MQACSQDPGGCRGSQGHGALRNQPRPNQRLPAFEQDTLTSQGAQHWGHSDINPHPQKAPSPGTKVPHTGMSVKGWREGAGPTD